MSWISSLKTWLKKIPGTRLTYHALLDFQTLVRARKVFVHPWTWFHLLRHKGNGTTLLETKDGLKIVVRKNIWDARIVQEIFLDRVYLKHFHMPLHPIVIDIGGYIGDFAIYMAHHYKSWVYVFEPMHENFEILKQNISINKLEQRITAVPKAVAHTPEVSIHVDLSEFQEIHASTVWYKDREIRKIPALSLEEILEDFKIDQVDLLKVDCEGCEYELFSHISPKIFERIERLTFEYHQVDDFEHQFEALRDFLSQMGYVLVVDTKMHIVYGSRRDVMD